MTKVIADITMSLDGYVTGAGADPQHGLGDAEELHAWVMDQDETDTDVLERATARSGAVIMGRRLFDTIDGPDGWSAEMGYGAQFAGAPPYVVVTHHPPDDVRLTRELGLSFTFVDDVAGAVEQARSAIDDDGKDVVIMGGGNVIAQAIELDLLDELHLHIAPLIVGAGTPMFPASTRQQYRQREVRTSRNAVHVSYERRRDEEAPTASIRRR
jgi:dihydrofolate reductase